MTNIQCTLEINISSGLFMTTCFTTKILRNVLKRMDSKKLYEIEKKELWKKDSENEKFKFAINNGDELLNS